MFNAIVVLWISRTQHTKALPWIIKQPLTGCIGRWLGLGHYIAEVIKWYSKKIYSNLFYYFLDKHEFP